jgi:hypothetical protein
MLRVASAESAAAWQEMCRRRMTDKTDLKK